MTIQELAGRYLTLHQSAEGEGVKQATAVVLVALSAFSPVEVVLKLLEQQHVALLRLQKGIELGDLATCMLALEHLFVYSSFFIDWLSTDLPLEASVRGAAQ